MFIGCLPITSLRLSSLDCFYRQVCVDKVKGALGLRNLSIISLDPFQSSQYTTNTTLSHIIDNLMLEDWSNKINYTEYFNQCNLKQCTYSITQRNNPLLIFTTLLALCKYCEISYFFIYYFIINRWWFNNNIEISCTYYR